MTQSKIEKRLKFLTYYAIALTILVLILIFGAFAESGVKHFKTISARRINIVEPNGQLAMVLSNTKRMPGAIVGGREISERKHTAGIIFYNGIGDETGGLIFGSYMKDSTIHQFVHLSFDSYKDDQVLVLNHTKIDDSTATQIRFMDRAAPFGFAKVAKKAWITRNGTPKEQKQAQQWLNKHYDEYKKGFSDRIIIGSFDQDAKIQLNDTKGRPRIRMVVDSSNKARLEFLDPAGNVIYSLPPKSDQ